MPLKKKKKKNRTRGNKLLYPGFELWFLILLPTMITIVPNLPHIYHIHVLKEDWLYVCVCMCIYIYIYSQSEYKYCTLRVHSFWHLLQCIRFLENIFLKRNKFPWWPFGWEISKLSYIFPVCLSFCSYIYNVIEVLMMLRLSS